MRTLSSMVLSLVFCAGLWAGDWPHFRGPNYDGTAVDCPPLIDSLSKDTAKELWQSPPLVKQGRPGDSSVTVVDGKAYTFAAPAYQVVVDRKKLEKGTLRGQGYEAELPAELRKAVEDARNAKEYTDIRDNKQREQWIKDWLDKNVPDDQKKYRGLLQTRLRQRGRAIDYALLDRIAPLVDREFPDEAALNAWFTENKFTPEDVKKVEKLFVVRERRCEDDVLCLDAADGKELWRTQLPSQWMWYMASSTPTVADGKVYVTTSEAKIACLDAKTGDKLWESKAFGRPSNSHNRSSSVLVVDGVAIAVCELSTVGVDAATGKELWRQRKVSSEYTSAIPVKQGNKTRVVINGKKKLTCLDPKTGDVVWTVKGGDGADPTIDGDLMLIAVGKDCGGKLIAYTLGDGEPTERWSVDFLDMFTSPVVHDGYVYVAGDGYYVGRKGRVLCINAKDGKVAWEQVVGPVQHANMLLADGKLFFPVGASLYMVKADPTKYDLLGDLNLHLERSVSPTIANGLLYLKTRNTVLCLDVRKK